MCVSGTADDACGAAEQWCTDCAAHPLGHKCLGGTTCGCNAAADCDPGKACFIAGHQCGTGCDANDPCNGGCCAGYFCATGTSQIQCGAGGGLCTDCTQSLNGYLCLSGTCGCNATSDCPPGRSCEVQIHTCM
jgi:hypothetical protein